MLAHSPEDELSLGCRLARCAGSPSADRLKTPYARTEVPRICVLLAWKKLMGEETEQNRIRLVLLDDHGLFRASLARFLAGEPGLEIAAECGTSAEALEVLNDSSVDIVLLDFGLGSERGNEFISAARQAGYQGRFLIVAGTADARSAAIALKLGASGVFLNSEAPERLVQAIRVVANREVWVDPKTHSNAS
jgi:ActR/RegA family two-component response regulator